MHTAAAAQETQLEVRNYLSDKLNVQMAMDVALGLTSDQKCLPSKYFYDARGSSLFERICHLPEYYLTRKELLLLKKFAGAFTRNFENGDLVELGSGANWKVRMLLDAMTPSARSGIRYVPVDVSEPAIVSASSDLARLYPELTVEPLVADFTTDLHRMPFDRMKLVLLFGSTIGNLDEDDAGKFLSSIRDCLGSGDRFLLGLDMVKSVQVLEAAYNDSQRVTEAFNKNILLVLNKHLLGNLNPSDFDHVAFFNESKERVEMHLRANRRVRVVFGAIRFSVTIEKGETIQTEICRKFRREAVEEIMNQAGLQVSGWYSDASNWFSIAEIVRD
ncbi:MAG: L-histidine N(alpha)-methyltransferase [Desulfomonile tiedjei]|nr:L-histidine N(alpha)-methyltransferase [Desulfomonile tiedjei]